MTHGKSHVVHLKYMAQCEPCEHDVINGGKENKENKEENHGNTKWPRRKVGGSFPQLIHTVEAIQKRGEMRK